MNTLSFSRATVRVIFSCGVGFYMASSCLLAHQPHDPMVAVAMSPNYAQDQTVLAATDYLSVTIGVYALLKSTNGGINWTVEAGLPNNRVTGIAFSPGYATDQTIFVSTLGGLFRTTNQGNSWNAVGGSALSIGVLGVALSSHFAVNHLAYAITSGSVYRSTNGGTTWTQLASPIKNAGLNVIAVSPHFPSDHTLLAGTNANGIFESTNAGATWTLVTSGITQQVSSLAFSPGYSSDRTIFAGTNGGGILITTNGGTTWTASNAGISDLRVTAIALSPNFTQNSTLWIATNTAGVYESANLGASWTKSTNVPRGLPPAIQTSVHYRVITAGATNTGTMIYLGMYEGLWNSNNGASSWNYIDTIPTHLVRHMKLSPAYAQDQTVFATTYGGGNLWSTTGGASWIIQNTGMLNSYPDATGISPNFTADGTAFSGMGGGLQRTTDFGATWQLMTMLGAPTYPRTVDVSPNYQQDATVMIGTDNRISPNPPTVTYNGQTYPNQGLFLSIDGGNNWVPTNLGGPPVDSISISPNFAADRTAFATSTTTGLYKSTDGGKTWAPITIPAVPPPMLLVKLSPAFATDNTVFAATSTSGIFKSTDAGSTWSLLPGSVPITALDIVISPNYGIDQTLFVGTIQQGLIKSTNGGQVFVSVSAYPDNYVNALAISPTFAQDGTIFGASYNGIYKSTDGGSTWAYTGEPAREEDDRTSSLPQSVGIDSPPSITYQGSWARTTVTQASSNAVTATSQPGATAILQFTGSSVRWLGSKGPQQGTASVQLDGVQYGPVNLKSAQALFQQPLWELHGLACGPHTLTITGTQQSGQIVTVDAFDIWQDTCPH
jgi:photosystem II stability/assembly factor-like uncharacterized protein